MHLYEYVSKEKFTHIQLRLPVKDVTESCDNYHSPTACFFLAKRFSQVAGLSIIPTNLLFFYLWGRKHTETRGEANPEESFNLGGFP
jgi:hypothetical protein